MPPRRSRRWRQVVAEGVAARVIAATTAATTAAIAVAVRNRAGTVCGPSSKACATAATIAAILAVHAAATAAAMDATDATDATEDMVPGPRLTPSPFRLRKIRRARCPATTRAATPVPAP